MFRGRRSRIRGISNVEYRLHKIHLTDLKTQVEGLMSIKLKLKPLIDIAMSIVLFILMSYQFMEQENHEIAGAIMLVLLILHHVMNYKCYSALGKGKYTPQRTLSTIIDFLILIDMILLMVSGIRMSRYVFKFLDLSFGMELARSLHMVSSYAGFLLMGIHIGLHFGMIQGIVRKALHITNKSLVRTWILRGIAGIISVYGIYALQKREFISYITLKRHFVFFDFEEPIIFYELDLLAIMVLTIYIGYYVQRFLIKKQKHNNKNDFGGKEK